MFVTCEVSKFDRSSDVKDSQEWNMYSISVILEVSKFDRSSDVRDSQKSNIEPISVT